MSNIIDSDSEIQLINVVSTNLQTEQQEETKKKVGRPRKYIEGARQHEKDTKYSSEYYREHKDKKIVCEFCNKEIVYIYKHQHYKSKLCQTIKAVKEQLKPLDV
jgi:hypothetical protein